MHIRTPLEWIFGQTDTIKTMAAAPPSEYWESRRGSLRPPSARKISTSDLISALRLGLQDFAAARTDVAFLCLIYPVVGLVLAVVTARGGLLELLFPVASGFALVGPFAAIGLYEISRRREADGDANWKSALEVLRSPNLGPICLLGGGLIGLFLLWLVAALGIYDVTLGPVLGAAFGPEQPVSMAVFVNALFTTPAGWAMIGLGFAVGAIFAVAVLGMSVISFPMLLDRPVSLRTAMIASIHALRRNPFTLGLWGVIIAAALFLGSLPCFLGLVVILPVLGHATWHLYRKLIRQ